MNKNDIKVVISDLDGTLINDKDQIPTDFKDMIKKLDNLGVIFVAASGRGTVSMENKLDHQADNLYIISDNGAIIKHKDRVIENTHFTFEETKEIIDAFKQTNNTAIIASTNTKSYAQIDDLSLEPLIKRFFSHYEIVDDIKSLDLEYVNVCMYSEENNDYNYNHPALDKLKEKYSIVRAGDVWTDAMPSGINKAVGIRKLLKHLDIDMKHTIAFGDYHNDIEMLKTVNVGYAMENAHDDVKAVADEVIGSNTNNSVIRKIYELFDISK